MNRLRPPPRRVRSLAHEPIASSIIRARHSLPHRLALGVALVAGVFLSACASDSPPVSGDTDAAALSPVGSSVPVGTTGPDAVPDASSIAPDAMTGRDSSTSSSPDGTTATPVGPGTTATTSSPVTAAPTTAAPATTVPITAVPSGWQAQMLSLINAQRLNAGVAPLTLCNALTRAAQTYSGVLAGWGTLSHVGPDGSTLYTRVSAAGYSGYLMVGENLAAGQLDAATVVTSWMGSSGHRANLLHQGFTQLGAGRTDVTSNGLTIPYWVLDLGAGGSC